MSPDADTTDSSATRRDALDVIDDRPDDPASRRSVLRGAFATGLAAVGATGPAAAVAPVGPVELELRAREFAGPGAVDRAVESHAGDLLAALAAAGYLDDAAPDAFDDRGVGAWYVGGTATARIDARTERADGRLFLSVEPHNDRAYAVHDDGDDRTLLRLDGDGALEEVSVTADGIACLSATLESDCEKCEEYEYTCESDGDCTLMETGNCCLGCPEGCNC